MRTNTLGQTALPISHLGFGCSHLTALRDRREAIQILDYAFDLGITHFDVARMYGQGRAEGILGEFLRGKRHKVTVATKFGIQPPSGLAGNRRVVDLIKTILGPFPGLLKRASQGSARMVQRGLFTPQSAVESLERSLHELGTDFIDVFLLHEARLEDAASESLIEFLEDQLKRGTIRSVGVASPFRVLEGESRSVPTVYQVLQFEDNVLERNVPVLRHRERCGLITHSIFQPLPALRERVAAQPELTRSYSDRLNLNLSDDNVLGSLLIHYALRNNPDGVVLFSSARPQRLEANVHAESLSYSDQQLSEFVKFTAEISGISSAELDRQRKASDV